MKKVVIGILIVLAVIGIIVFAIYRIASNQMEALENIGSNMENNFIIKHEVKRENISSFIRGNGEITSFNIKKLDVESYETVKDYYVEDGELVSAKQKLLRVSGGSNTRNITSPIQGMFFNLQEAMSGEEIFYVYDLSNIGVKISVSEEDVINLKIGQKAIIKVNSLNREIEGIVTYISNLPQNNRFSVKVKLDYTEDLKFGYATTVRIITEEKENTIVIPYAAIKRDEAGRTYVVKSEYEQNYTQAFFNGNDVAEEFRTYVDVGFINSKSVEITSGLTEGEKVLYTKW